MHLMCHLTTSLLGNFSRAMVYRELVCDCDGFPDVYICQNIKLYLLNVCSTWHVKYASNEALKIKEMITSVKIPCGMQLIQC